MARRHARKQLSRGAAVLLVIFALLFAAGRLLPRAPRAAPGDVAAGFSAATVERVVDGDTAIFRLASGARERVRFIGVNTPEDTTKHEPYGPQATAYTRRLLPPGRGVLLEPDVQGRDRYGRLLEYVWLAAPTEISDAEIRDKMLNAKLAIDGYAQQMTIPPDVKYADYFRRYVAEARDAGRGLWSPDLRP